MPKLRRFRTVSLARPLAARTLWLGGILAACCAAALPAAETKKILLLTYSETFQHPCVKGEGGGPSLVERTLTELGKKGGFDVTATSDASRLSPEFLASFDGLFFYTQGDLDKVGIDKGAMKSQDRKLICDFVRSGKGFVATHSGGDTFHQWFDGPEMKEKPYVDMLGAEFTVHGPQQVARVTVLDKSFPACSHLPTSFELNDEWYQYHNFSDEIHVLMMLETAGMKGEMYQRPSYPITWCRTYGKGRVFYTGMGHRDDVWTNPMYQTMIVQGVLWSLGGVAGEAPANYREVNAKARMPEGFTRLFDGSSLDGWKSPQGAAFELKNGAITAVGGGKTGDFFYASKKLKDFELGVEWLVGDRSFNSGVWVRSPELFEKEEDMLPRAFEVQIQDNRDDQHRTGAIYGLAPSTSLPSRAAGQWNEFRIRCVGNKVTVFLNDAPVTSFEAKDERAREGYVALQNHGDTVAFRNIWLRPLE
ncbi:MAG TPA: family 16 glycoside hydrolase [Planctomycetota bacterium]|nr:family 16 glycoside hydrolase [Planctomycetota bacterium]